MHCTGMYSKLDFDVVCLFLGEIETLKHFVKVCLIYDGNGTTTSYCVCLSWHFKFIPIIYTLLTLHYRSDHYKLIQIRVVNLQSGNGQDGLQVLHLLTDASEDDFFF